MSEFVVYISLTYFKYAYVTVITYFFQMYPKTISN